MKQISTLLAIIIVLILPGITKAQNIFPSSGSAGIGTVTPDASSILEVKSTTKGMLIPRMSKIQRDAIAVPATGLMIYQTNNTPGFYYYDGSAWKPVTPKSANNSLSNLTAPTAVNQHLSPGLNALDLGNKKFLWRKIFVGDGLYNASFRILKIDSTNTAAGVNTLTVNTGKFNTALGADVLRSNSNGVLNVAVGASALAYNTTGNGNTATGTSSMTVNTTGNFNTASGYTTLASNTSGSYNVAIGDYALHENTTGYSNIAIGTKALYKSVTINNLIAIGDSAMLNNTNGEQNIAIGSRALFTNIFGLQNSAIGFWAMKNNVAGLRNVAVGVRSLETNDYGDENTAVGVYALSHNTEGNYNTAVGNNSLNDADGDFNSAIGFYADVLYYNVSNSTAIGAHAAVDASNKVRIGSTSVTSIGGQVGWSVFSDGRYKKNIKENVPGLVFINALRPLTYTVDVNGLNNYFKKGDQGDSNRNNLYKNAKSKPKEVLQDSYDKAAKISHTGFIAQEVEAVANKLGYDFSGVDKPDDKNKIYGLRYDEFVVPLVKAVQELSHQNDELKKQNAAQQKINADLQKQINELKIVMGVKQSVMSDESSANVQLSSAILEQNIPNPFNHTTTINYILPQQFTSAQIIITDKMGKTIKAVDLSNLKGTRKGSLTLDASSLASGTYIYSLYLNGKLIEAKQMMLAR